MNWTIQELKSLMKRTSDEDIQRILDITSRLSEEDGDHIVKLAIDAYAQNHPNEISIIMDIANFFKNHAFHDGNDKRQCAGMIMRAAIESSGISLLKMAG